MAVLDDKRWKVDELEGTADEPKMVEITIETNQVAPLLTPPPPLVRSESASSASPPAPQC